MSEKHSSWISCRDLTGQVFGRLTAIERAVDGTKDGQAWVCNCSCGKVRVVLARRLLSGNSRSCGCLRRDWSSRELVTHGQTVGGQRTPTYRAWKAMCWRCNPAVAKDYPKYAGVYLDPSWKDFETFFRDMGPRPEGTSIDRIKAELGYRPGNCRWATSTEQARNRKNNRLLECNGKVQCLEAWARELGVRRSLISDRLKRGWSVADALARPPRKLVKRADG